MKSSDIDKYELELSTDCNAECPLCMRTVMNMPLRGNQNISLNDLKKVFPTQSLIEGREFKLCGILGDPIINSECLEICNFLSNHGARKIAISTNGGYNTPEWWSKLAKVPNVQVDFAVDGYENTNHIYRVNVKWNTLLRNMRAYSEQKGKATWVFIPFAHNEEDYELAENLAKELNFKFIKRTSGRTELSNKKHKSKKMNNEVILTGSKKYKHENIESVKKTLEAKNNNDIDYLNSLVPTINCKHKNLPELYIAADLTLWPCCFLYDEHVTGKYKGTQLVPDYIEKDFNSLKTYTIDQILEHNFYKTLHERWFATHPEYIFRCIKNCSNNASYVSKKHYDNQ